MTNFCDLASNMENKMFYPVFALVTFKDRKFQIMSLILIPQFLWLAIAFLNFYPWRWVISNTFCQRYSHTVLLSESELSLVKIQRITWAKHKVRNLSHLGRSKKLQLFKILEVKMMHEMSHLCEKTLQNVSYVLEGLLELSLTMIYITS